MLFLDSPINISNYFMLYELFHVVFIFACLINAIINSNISFWKSIIPYSHMIRKNELLYIHPIFKEIFCHLIFIRFKLFLFNRFRTILLGL
jgi:hypothetical protein